MSAVLLIFFRAFLNTFNSFGRCLLLVVWHVLIHRLWQIIGRFRRQGVVDEG